MLGFSIPSKLLINWGRQAESQAHRVRLPFGIKHLHAAVSALAQAVLPKLMEGEATQDMGFWWIPASCITLSYTFQKHLSIQHPFT